MHNDSFAEEDALQREIHALQAEARDLDKQESPDPARVEAFWAKHAEIQRRIQDLKAQTEAREMPRSLLERPPRPFGDKRRVRVPGRSRSGYAMEQADVPLQDENT